MDVSAEIARQQARLRGQWGEIRVGGGGTFTEAVILERGQSLVMGPGIYDVSQFPIKNFGVVRCKGDNTVEGAGETTVLMEHEYWAWLRPYWGAFFLPRPSWANLTFRKVQVRGRVGNPVNSAVATIELDNTLNGIVEHCYFNAIHSLGANSGGAPNTQDWGNNHAIRHNVWIGGDNDWAGGCGTAFSAVNSTNVKIHDNRILRMGPAGGIDIEAPDSDYRMENFEIYNNFIDTRRFPRDPETGVEMPSGDVFDTPNQAYPDQPCGTPCIIIHGVTGGYTGPGRVSGNFINGGHSMVGVPNLTTHANWSSNGIYMFNVSAHGIVIEGNQISNVNSEGIHLQGHHLVCRGNTIFNTGGIGPGITISGRHCQVYGNTLMSYAGGRLASIKETMIPGLEQFIDWNDIRENYVGWGNRPPGAGNLEPQVILAKDSNPAHAPNSRRGGKTGANHMRINDVQEHLDPNDLPWP